METRNQLFVECDELEVTHRRDEMGEREVLIVNDGRHKIEMTLESFKWLQVAVSTIQRHIEEAGL